MHLFVKEEHLEIGLQATKVREAWYSLMTGSLSKYTKNIHFEKGVLTIFTQSPIFKHELQLTKNAILEQLNIILSEKLIKQILIK
jgi:hypothetical protein